MKEISNRFVHFLINELLDFLQSLQKTELNKISASVKKYVKLDKVSEHFSNDVRYRL